MSLGKKCQSFANIERFVVFSLLYQDLFCLIERKSRFLKVRVRYAEGSFYREAL